MITCSVCGSTDFKDQSVIWDGLAAEWQISPHERAYIDRQQGTACTTCGANLRSIALAGALLSAIGSYGTLNGFTTLAAAGSLSILEINEAGNLSAVLRRLSGHVFASYPDVDMHAMPYAADSFDIVVHSDTLEHVANPVRALAECRRVLKPGGSLCFTIPVIVGRLSRSRAGLAKSYHGDPTNGDDDFVVHTEFGADMWTYAVQAGFSSVTLNVIDFPSAIALSARK